MSDLSIRMFSQSLRRFTNFQMVMPTGMPPVETMKNSQYDRPVKTLILLHGYSGNCMDWYARCDVGELALKYNVAIVMPSGDNSFYLNMEPTGYQYEDFICKELIEYLRATFGIAKTPEDTFIGGLSMGGFGAIHSGLAHPECFGKMFALSAALICERIKGMKSTDTNPTANYDYYALTFGDLSALDLSANNPKFLVKSRLKKGEQLQPIFMACGTEDSLIETNRDFKNFLQENGVDLLYKESPGIHDWKFWNDYLEPAIIWGVDA